MVRGLESFTTWFQDYSDQYVIIGGTACDLLMSEEGFSFRGTKDIDLVLIVESLNRDFGMHFWNYVTAGGYERKNKSNGTPQFYRFTNPLSKDFPSMIELFSTSSDSIILPEHAVLTPLPIDDEVSSLSAILLESDYYEFLKMGRVRISGLTLLDALHLIPFKAKAWMDLCDRKENGELIDSKNIRKHKNDVFRLTELIDRFQENSIETPRKVISDMEEFLRRISKEDVELRQLGIMNRTKEDIIKQLGNLYRER
ncbi:MAG: hypothetical protein IJI41_06910 [Anaerolineaceae bacterium]|nr:hypothetical protein [Anaerolineaceae bacterium]